MSQFPRPSDRRIGLRPFILGGTVAIAFFTASVSMRTPRANAQQQGYLTPIHDSDVSHYKSPRPITHSASNVVDPKDQIVNSKVAVIQSTLNEKTWFFREKLDQVDLLLEVIHECQSNIDDQTTGFVSDGFDNTRQDARVTKWRIQQDKRTIKAASDKIALLMEAADNLDRRVVQLRMSVTQALQPDPSRLLSLKKKEAAEINAILRNVDADDHPPTIEDDRPLSIDNQTVGIELHRIAACRAKWEPLIRAEESKLLNRAADQGLAASEWEISEHERWQRLKTQDLPRYLHDDYYAYKYARSDSPAGEL